MYTEHEINIMNRFDASGTIAMNNNLSNKCTDRDYNLNAINHQKEIKLIESRWFRFIFNHTIFNSLKNPHSGC